jgi:membrane-bound lytic murein transglycosylase B
MRYVAFGVLAFLIGFSSVATAEQPAQPFADWLRAFQADARQAGIRDETLSRTLPGLYLDETVIRLDQKQPEGRITQAKYLSNTITQKRIDKGRQILASYGPLLQQIERQTGVPANIVVALTGIETDYGRNMGGFSVINSLATLAYEGRRAAYFREELLDALKIIDRGHIQPDELTGSWAGAMGMVQFMPSTWHRYAVDYNGDGRKNIWTDPADAFASAAYYLQSIGWQTGMPWGQKVTIPKGFDSRQSGKAVLKPVAAWAKLGVRGAGGQPLMAVGEDVALILPDGSDGNAYLVTRNFRVILEWNRSTYFGTAVGTLANRLGNSP